MRIERFLPTETATRDLGLWLGQHLKSGSVVALIGPLGAGKTTLTRAIAEGLGADTKLVASPTFALVHEYPARLPIFHFDAYRLECTQAFLDLGIEEYMNSDGVCLIEWADRVATVLPADAWRISLTHEGAGRRVVIETPCDIPELEQEWA